MPLLHSYSCSCPSCCSCSCCDLALTHCRDRHAAEKDSKSQVASGRPEASAGQQMLAAPRVSWDQHGLRNIYLHAGLNPSWGLWMLPLYEYLLQQMIIFPHCSPLVCILFVCLASGVLCFPITLLFPVFSCSAVIYPTVYKKNNLGMDSCFFDGSFLSWGFVLL